MNGLRKRVTMEHGNMILTVATDPVADYAILSLCGPLKTQLVEMKLNRGQVSALIGTLQDARYNLPEQED